MKKHLGNIVSWSSVFIVFLGIYSFNPICLVSAIIVAAFMDLFDGKLARKYTDDTHYNNMFGELTDSLCDLFNFGVAPSLILVYMLNPREFQIFDILACFLFVFCGMFRLARFSALKDKKLIDYYVGIPITVAGPVLAIALFYVDNYNFQIFITCALALLMVSKIKIKKLKLGEKNEN